MVVQRKKPVVQTVCRKSSGRDPVSVSDPRQWRFVPTKENPADLVTRGLKVSELANCEKWWNGPGFLGNDESEWPINRVNVD